MFESICGRISWLILSLRFRQKGATPLVGFYVLALDRAEHRLNQTFHEGVRRARLLLEQHVALRSLDERAAKQLSMFDRWYDRILENEELENDHNCDVVIVCSASFAPHTPHDLAHYAVSFTARYANGANLGEKGIALEASLGEADIAQALAIEVSCLVLAAKNSAPPRPDFDYDPAVWPFPDSCAG